MCTNGNLDSAKAIAYEAGIVSEKDINDDYAKYICTTG
jgi:hypothetical protein